MIAALTAYKCGITTLLVYNCAEIYTWDKGWHAAIHQTLPQIITKILKFSVLYGMVWYCIVLYCVVLYCELVEDFHAVSV